MDDKSSLDFVAFMSSFKEMNGRIKNISEVINIPVIQAIENTRAEQFKKLAESFKFYATKIEEKNDAAAAATTASAINNQKFLEQILKNVTNSKETESNISGERGKLESADKEKIIKEDNSAFKKKQEGYFNSLIESLKDGFKALRPAETSQFFSEVAKLIVGGGLLIMVGKYLKVPLAEALYNVLEKSVSYITDTLAKKFDVKSETMSLGVKGALLTAASVLLFGFTNTFKLAIAPLWAATTTLKSIGWLFKGSAEAATTSATALQTASVVNAARTTTATTEIVNAAGKIETQAVNTFARTSTSLGSIFKVAARSILGSVLSVFEAKNFLDRRQEAGEALKEGNTEASKLKSISAWLSGASAVTGAGAVGTSFLGLTGIGASVPAILAGTSAITGLAATAVDYFADKKIDEKREAMAAAAAATADKLKKEKSDKGESGATITNKAMADKAPQLAFEESIENLGLTIDKSISTLMDWDRRGLNPLQALTETLQKSFVGQKKEQKSQLPANAQRDMVNAQRHEAASSLFGFRKSVAH